MSVEIWRDPMTGSAYLRNGGVKVKLDPMVADAFAELQSSMSALWAEQMRRLLEKELGKSKSLGAMNSRLREQLQDAERDESRAWDRVRKAEAENAKLRERVAELDELLPENGRWFSFETVDAYVVENRKLRELVQDFDKCLTEAVRLAYIQGHATIYDGTLLDSLHPRMRELGIEVDA